MSRTIVASGAAKYGIALRTQDYFNEFFYAKAGQQYVNHNGGRDGRATKALLDNPTGRKIWTWWKDMVDSGLALNTGSAEGNFDHLLAIGTGDAAMSIEASSALGTILQVLQSGQYAGVDPAAGPLPSLKPGGGVPVGDGSLWISKRSSPAKQAAAWEFAKFLVAPEQQASLTAATGYVPVRISAASSPRVLRVLGGAARVQGRVRPAAGPGGSRGERVGDRQLPGGARRRHGRAHVDAHPGQVRRRRARRCADQRRPRDRRLQRSDPLTPPRRHSVGRVRCVGGW